MVMGEEGECVKTFQILFKEKTRTAEVSKGSIYVRIPRHFCRALGIGNKNDLVAVLALVEGKEKCIMLAKIQNNKEEEGKT